MMRPQSAEETNSITAKSNSGSRMDAHEEQARAGGSFSESDVWGLVEEWAQLWDTGRFGMHLQWVLGKRIASLPGKPGLFDYLPASILSILCALAHLTCTWSTYQCIPTLWCEQNEAGKVDNCLRSQLVSDRPGFETWWSNSKFVTTICTTSQAGLIRKGWWE